MIDDPDVVLWIDTDLLRKHEAVASLSDLANEFPVSIELEQPRTSVGERTGAAERNRGMAGARVNENITLGIRRHATDLAQIDVVRECQRIWIGIEGNLRHCILRCGWDRGKERRGKQ